MSTRILLFLGLLANSTDLTAQNYDPLRVDRSVSIEIKDVVINDTSRDREIPIRVYLPNIKEPAPVVLFSHGLGGSRENNPYLGKHWGEHGYATVYLQHAGSDDSVWRDAPLWQRMAAMKQAASGQNLILRLDDVRVALDQLETWNKEPDHPLYMKLDLTHVGMSGHSFGAQTTQGVSGQSLPLVRQKYTDDRIKAAVAFSPAAPVGQQNAASAFGQVNIPWLLMTGTNDTSPIGGQTVESRLKVYPALPPGDKFEIVLHGAEHSAFGDRQLPGDRQDRNENHHRVILALSTAFWDAYLKNDPTAQGWLQGEGPTNIMDAKDRWQQK